jgi:hypothetical protein
VIAGEFFAVDVKDGASPKLFDSFQLDLQSHKLRTQIAPVNAK